MDAKTGRIYPVGPTQAQKRGLVSIPEDQVEEVKAMSLTRRRTWAANRKNAVRKEKKKTTRKNAARERAKTRRKR